MASEVSSNDQKVPAEIRGNSTYYHPDSTIGDLSLAFACRSSITKVEALDLSGCEHITNLGLRVLEKLAALSRLKLTSCSKLFNEPFAGFPSLRRLTDLDLSGCHLIKALELREVLNNCPNLRIIDLSYCPHLCGPRFLEVMSGRRGLEEIRLDSSFLTYDDVLGLIKVLPNLKKLDLSWWEKITGEQVEELRKNHRDLVIVKKKGELRYSVDPD